MACERCSAPCQGRLCSLCEADDRMDEIGQKLTEKYDQEDKEHHE